MDRTLITGTSLLCEAEIAVRILGATGNPSSIYGYSLHNKPCFGDYFRGVPNQDGRNKTLVNIDIDIFQFIDKDILAKYHENNYCSLTPEQLGKYHRELEFVFSKFSAEEETGVKISVEETTRRYDQDCNIKPIQAPAIKIHIEAQKMKAYQLLCLMTLIRCSSEYPNALLLRECFNLQEHGFFKEFSIMSLFGLLQNRMQYAYDQGPIQWMADGREKFYKPSCLEFLQDRMTPGSNGYSQTGNKVQNFYEVCDRGPKNKEKFEFPRWCAGGGTELGNGKLYPSDKCIEKIFNGEIIEEHLDSFNQIRDAIYYQWPKLKTDHPEEKVMQS
jgi:hypothetical protein